MTRIKLTKMELREQQYKQKQLQKYLPILQLKKAMLQIEVQKAALEVAGLKKQLISNYNACQEFQGLLTIQEYLRIKSCVCKYEVQKTYENFAGADLPVFTDLIFENLEYSLVETPLWIDGAQSQLRLLCTVKEKVNIALEKKSILEKELREVFIRVNLFEKVLIPRTQGSIKKIKVFLGDQELASVAQAKMAKNKIEKRRKEGLEI